MIAAIREVDRTGAARRRRRRRCYRNQGRLRLRAGKIPRRRSGRGPCRRLSPSRVTPTTGTVTDLSHGRTAIRIAGPKAEWVLAKFFAIDFSLPAFPVGSGLSTVHHDIFAQIQRSGADQFDIYVFRPSRGRSGIRSAMRRKRSATRCGRLIARIASRRSQPRLLQSPDSATLADLFPHADGRTRPWRGNRTSLSPHEHGDAGGCSGVRRRPPRISSSSIFRRWIPAPQRELFRRMNWTRNIWRRPRRLPRATFRRMEAYTIVDAGTGCRRMSRKPAPCCDCNGCEAGDRIEARRRTGHDGHSQPNQPDRVRDADQGRRHRLRGARVAVGYTGLRWELTTPGRAAPNG